MDYEVSGQAPNVASAVVPHVQNVDGTVSPASRSTPLPVQPVASVGSIAWGAATAVTMTGSTKNLIGANAARKGIIIWNPAGNAAAAVDLSGTAVTLAGGIPLLAGNTPTVLTGADCPVSAITAIGANTQNLYYSEGT